MNVDKCCICFESICATNDMCITKCGHHFHTSCILKCNGTCPLCRTKLLDPKQNTSTSTHSHHAPHNDVLSAQDVSSANDVRSVVYTQPENEVDITIEDNVFTSQYKNSMNKLTSRRNPLHNKWLPVWS
jgi:hypothetical protein